MVCAKSPTLTTFDTLKKEALIHLDTLAPQICQPNRILVIDSVNPNSWKLIPALSGFEVEFVESVHYILRSGIYQKFTIFGIPENCAEISPEDFEKLLNLRLLSPVAVLGYNRLREMTTDHMQSLLQELNSEDQIQRTVTHIEKTRGSLDSISLDGSGNKRIRQMDTESTLREFLRSHIRSNVNNPETILKGAIELIRPQR